jgi:hypothetical protein
MRLILKATKRRIKKKVERDFQWYDTYSQQMLYGRGGEMRFHYNPELKHSIPYVVDAEEWVTENNFDDILKWVEQHDYEVLNMSPNYSIELEIDHESLDDLAFTLYNKKIVFDWEET